MPDLPRFTFINGPPGSGKSTLAELLCKKDTSIWRESFANPIREMIYSVFFPEEGFAAVSTLDLREGEVKKRPFPFYPPHHGALTFRDAMISFSEDWMKPKFGQDIFGRLALRRCVDQEHFYERFIFDDCGFAREIEAIVKYAGNDNCLLLRLHRDGCNFSNDSRGYIRLENVPTIDLYNNDSLEELAGALELELGVL